MNEHAYPEGFSSWSEANRNAYFAQEAKAYDERKRGAKALNGADLVSYSLTLEDACLMTFLAGEARRNRWERVTALSQRRGSDRDVADRLTGRARVGSPSSFPHGLDGYPGESPE